MIEDLSKHRNKKAKTPGEASVVLSLEEALEEAKKENWTGMIISYVIDDGDREGVHYWAAGEAVEGRWQALGLLARVQQLIGLADPVD